MKHDLTIIRSFLLIVVITGISCFPSLAAEDETAYIDLTVSGSHIEIGDVVYLEGYIVPSLLIHPGDRLLLQVTSPKSSRADVYYRLKADKDGIFSMELPADAIGDWSFIVRYEGYSSEAVPLTVTSRAKVKEAELVISGPFSILHAGDTARMSGWLRDFEGNGINYRQVWYSFGLPSYSCVLCGEDARRIWQTLGPVITDEAGYLEFSFDCSDPGKYAVKASFPGDEIYAAAESDTLYPRVL